MKLTIKYGAESISKSFDTAPTVAQVIGNPNIKAVLGFGDNVKALVSGIEQDSDASLFGVSELVLETRANSKASDLRVRISYGADGVDKMFDFGSTIADVVQNSNLKAVLGFGDNIKVLVNGVEQTLDTELSDGISLVIETKANSKAV
jgi:2-phosphoglycerate kinase